MKTLVNTVDVDMIFFILFIFLWLETHEWGVLEERVHYRREKFKSPRSSDAFASADPPPKMHNTADVERKMTSIISYNTNSVYTLDQ